MVETLTTGATVKLFAGANYSTDLTDANITTFINQAEGHISFITMVDWVDRYASIDANYKQALDEATAAWAAMMVINYDMSGYTSRFEAGQMLNILWTKYDQAVRWLKNKANTDFLIGGET